MTEVNAKRDPRICVPTIYVRWKPLAVRAPSQWWIYISQLTFPPVTFIMWHKYACLLSNETPAMRAGVQEDMKGSAHDAGVASSGCPTIQMCVRVCYHDKRAVGCLLLPTFRQLEHFYFSSPYSPSPALTCPFFNLSFYLFTLSISTFPSICAIIAPPQREFGWCLADTNKQGWSWGMFLSRGKIKRIRGESTTAFIETLEIPRMETRTWDSTEEGKLIQTREMQWDNFIEFTSSAAEQDESFKFCALFEANLACLGLE